MSYPAPGAKKLSYGERHDLDQHEARIEKGLKDFREVGAALLSIRDRELYREKYATFEGYCEDRWLITRSQGYRLMEAAQVMSNLSPIGDIPDTSHAIPLPTNECQVRPLAALDTAEQQAAAWRDARGRDAKPTGRTVAEAVQRLKDTLGGPDKSDNGKPGGNSPADVRRREAAAAEKLRRDSEPERLVAIGRCVVRAEAVAEKMDAADRNLLITALAAVRDALTAIGPWPWQDRRPATVYPDGRTPQDRFAERERERERNPRAREQDTERKKRDRRREREEKVRRGAA